MRLQRAEEKISGAIFGSIGHEKSGPKLAGIIIYALTIDGGGARARE